MGMPRSSMKNVLLWLWLWLSHKTKSRLAARCVCLWINSTVHHGFWEMKKREGCCVQPTDYLMLVCTNAIVSLFFFVDRVGFAFAENVKRKSSNSEKRKEFRLRYQMSNIQSP